MIVQTVSLMPAIVTGTVWGREAECDWDSFRQQPAVD